LEIKQNERHSAFPHSRDINVLPQIPLSQVKSKQKASFVSNCVQIAFAKLNSQPTKIEHILRLYVFMDYLVTLTVAKILRRMVGCLVQNKLKEMGTEVVVA
jgi:hypothetical protein